MVKKQCSLCFSRIPKDKDGNDILVYCEECSIVYKEVCNDLSHISNVWLEHIYKGE